MDAPTFQTLFNVALTLFMFIAGWFMHVMWDAHKEVRKDAKDAKDDVRAIEKEVANTYVRKDDFHQFMQPIRAQLDRIEEKLDRKVDK